MSMFGSSGPNPLGVSLGQYNALARENQTLRQALEQAQAGLAQEIADHETTRVAWGLDVQTLQAQLQAFIDGRARKALVTVHPSLLRRDALRSRN
jgi:hypothetical protein